MVQFFVYASCSSFRSSFLCFIFYFLPASEKGWNICKADIRNPLSLLAHERSRFATCQRELLTPTDISILLTPRLVFYALEAGECLFCVQLILSEYDDICYPLMLCASSAAACLQSAIAFASSITSNSRSFISTFPLQMVV